MHEVPFAAPCWDQPDADSDPPDDVEQSLERLQEERCACMAQLQALFADSFSTAAQIDLYIHRIEAINEIMLSLARVTTAEQPSGSTPLDHI